MRTFRCGAHGAYDVIMIQREREYIGPVPTLEPSPTVKWVSFGLHAGVAP